MRLLLRAKAAATGSMNKKDKGAEAASPVGGTGSSSGVSSGVSSCASSVASGSSSVKAASGVSSSRSPGSSITSMGSSGMSICTGGKGSWAGAMGHFQFMPSTFNAYAVDFNQDGEIDIWRSFEDASASAANYLSSIGWKENDTIKRRYHSKSDIKLKVIIG